MLYKVGHSSSNDYLLLPAGEAITFRQALYVGQDNKFYIAQNPETTGGVGFAMNSGGYNQLIMGKISGLMPGFSGLVPRQFYGPGANGTLVQEVPYRSMARAMTPEIILILAGPYRMAVLWEDVVDKPIMESLSFTLAVTDIANKYIELPYKILSDPSGVLFHVEDGPVFFYGQDYVCQVDPVSKVIWDGKKLDGRLLVGDVVRVAYWRSPT